MDLNNIQIFTKVVQEGSFVAASKSLGVPRSTVSRRVAELERQLGARLLQRTTRRLHLTEVGETYFQYTTGIMDQIEQAHVAVTQLQGVPRGLLRVTAPMSFGHLGVPLASYLKRYPEVQVEVVCTDRVVDLVQHGFDAAIRVGRLPDSTLIARPLGPLRSILVASPGFLEKRNPPKVPSDLETLDCLLFAAGTSHGSWTLRNRKKTFEVKVRPRYRANDMDYLRDAAIAGLGVAMLPVHVCKEGMNNGTLQRVLPDWCSQEIQVSALYPSARLLSPKLNVFLEHLREHFQATASD
jgi:DNA-binding transcriptional LysR family regulator